MFTAWGHAYTLLTGRSPFDPADDEILTKVKRGEFEQPHVIQPRIPKPLEAICLKAMAHNPGHRYATPQDLAEDIEPGSQTNRFRLISRQSSNASAAGHAAIGP